MKVNQTLEVETTSLIIIFFKQYLKDMLNAIGTAITAVASFYALDSFAKKKELNNASTSTQRAPPNTFFKKQTIEPPIRKIDYPHYSILYSTYHKNPLAVYEFITKEIAEGDAPRSRFFYPDDHIKQKHFQVDNTYFYETKAYFMFNINRGHMAAAGNYSGSISEKFLTFSFANIVPQDGTNNGGIWNTFERYSRGLAVNGLCDSVEVISGPIFPKNSPYTNNEETKVEGEQEKDKAFRSELKVLKRNGAIIPEKLYKIIKCNTKTGPYIGTYQNLNSRTEDNHKDLNHFQVKLSDVQKQTGLKFDIQGKNLKELDGSTLQKTKKQIDYPFYFGLMQNSVSLSEMSSGLRRAMSQHIDIQVEKLSEKIKQMTKKESDLVASRDLSSCQKFKKMLSLSKKLGFLKHTQAMAEERQERTSKYFTECKETEEYSEVMKLNNKQVNKFIQKLEQKTEA